MVGFAMYGCDRKTTKVWIIRLMIDQKHQQKGYGRLAMRALIARLNTEYAVKEIYVSYEPDNIVMQKFCRELGFVETGDIEEGELVAKMVV